MILVLNIMINFNMFIISLLSSKISKTIAIITTPLTQKVLVLKKI